MSRGLAEGIPTHRRRRDAVAALVLAAALAGCRGERTLSLTSTPVGAEARLDDELLGVTPLTIPIDHYGRRRLTLYLPDSRLYSEPIDLNAPWWTYFPVDILTELLNPIRLHDRQSYHVDLLPATGVEAEPVTASFIEEAIRIRTEARAEGITPEPDSPERGAPPVPATDEPKSDPKRAPR